ncbi:MAG: N-acetylmuramoyl-L-alanine amidase [Candidatus Eisenbacteria bacterium]
MKPLFALLNLILASSLVVSITPRMCRAQTVVVYSDGRPSEGISIVERDGKPYITASQVARLLSLERSVDLANDKVTLKSKDHYVEIIIGGTVWVSDGATVKVGEPAFKEGDEVYVNLVVADAILAGTFGKSLKWDATRKRLLVGLPAPNIIDIEVHSEPQQVTATIKTIGALRYELLPVAENKLELLVKGGVFSKRLGFVAEGGLVERIEAGQEAEGARIVVTLAGTNPSYRVFPQWGPDGIIVKVWTPVLTEIPEPEFRPPKRLAWQERFSAERAGLNLVVLDPGHGGENRGSLGATGYLEKQFNLELARKLRQSLESKGIQVIMTRNDDISVPLETRTEVANSVGADLFISIHANGFASSAAKGFEVYFLSPALDDDARFVAATENSGIEPASILSDGGDEVAFILWDTAQAEFVAESSYLAQLVDEEIAKVVTIPNRGVKQASFFVLKGAYLPGIMVETAFITNPQEEVLLRDGAFQDKIVGAIMAAISRFKEDYNR